MLGKKRMRENIWVRTATVPKIQIRRVLFGTIQCVKRFRRYLFNGLTGLSLLISIATLAAWLSGWNVIYDPLHSQLPYFSRDYWGSPQIYELPLSWGYFLVLSLLLPGLWLKRRLAELRSHRVIAQGLCIMCGYDLRATPDRCPECGTVPKKDLSVHQMREII
jgi:hypothetical protein